MNVPNVCWSYWESAGGAKPEVVAFCEESWAKNGRFSEVNLLTPETLNDFLGPEDLPSHFVRMPLVKKANAVRLALLAEYGGYWLDAGVAVSSSVEEWVSRRASNQGFFAFQGVGKDRQLATWFLAAPPNCGFVVEWNRLYNEFFSRTRLHETHSPTKTPSVFATHLLARINGTWMRASPSRTAHWAKRPMMWLPFYPYFIMHYIANKILEDPEFRIDFMSMVFETASAPLGLRLIFSGAESPTRTDVDGVLKDMPLHKLNTYRNYSRRELQMLRSAFRTEQVI